MAEQRICVTIDLPDELKQEFLNLSSEVKIKHGDGLLSREELLKFVVGCDALVCSVVDKIDVEILNAAGPQLKIISTISVGYDHIDVAECKKRHIVIGHTPGVLSDAVAELTIGLLLTTTRRLAEGIEAVKSGIWGPFNMFWLCGTQLNKRTIGIVGLGKIGLAVAERLVPFGVGRIIYSGRKEKSEAAKFNGTFVDFTALLQESDIVIICCALTHETKDLFNQAAFSKMKKNAIMINISRGPVVNQDDLYTALTTGQIQAAGLDVTTPEPFPTDHPLMKLKNCVIFPHIGSGTVETRTEMIMRAFDNLKAGLKGQPLPFSVY